MNLHILFQVMYVYEVTFSVLIHPELLARVFQDTWFIWFMDLH